VKGDRPRRGEVADRREGRGRRDESEDRRKEERRSTGRRVTDRRLRRRRDENCPTCGQLLTPEDYCPVCKVRVIRVRRRS
jgi:hypothetical protein